MYRLSYCVCLLVLGCVDNTADSDTDATETEAEASSEDGASEATEPSTAESSEATSATDNDTVGVSVGDTAELDAGTRVVHNCAPWFSVSVDPEQLEGSATDCSAVPPECEPNAVAELTRTAEHYSCWTGRCLPARDCSYVNDCDECTDGTYCMLTIVTGVSFHPNDDVDQDVIRVQCLPFDESCSAEACECGADMCRNGSCSLGPLNANYDNEYTGALVQSSNEALICTQYDG